jgi:hypothetical protein
MGVTINDEDWKGQSGGQLKMQRKKVLGAIALLFCCIGWMLAGRSQASVKPIQNIDEALAAVPLPKLSAAEALDIAKKLTDSRAPFGISTVVAIDWCKSSDFHPRYVDGADLLGLNNDKYAWFITYIEPPSGLAPVHVRSVAILRIYDNGHADIVAKVRT